MNAPAPLSSVTPVMGSPFVEEWRPIPGWEDLYYASNLGRIRSNDRLCPNPRGRGQRLKKGRIFKGTIAPPGYVHMPLCREAKQVYIKAHRLVAMAFLPNPENKPQVNHKNGIKADNRVENLEWVTAGENLKHAYAFLNHTRICFSGETNGSAKLTDKKVLEIRRLRKHEATPTIKLARLFGVTTSCIKGIFANKSWTHLAA